MPKVMPNKKVELSNTQKIEVAKNKEQIKDRNKKFKLYALFQFTSTSAIFLVSLALGLVVYLGVHLRHQIDQEFFKKEFGDVMTFNSSESLHTFTSILSYLGFMTWIISIGFALLLHSNKQRSLFDTAFLLFFFVPFLSNVIALFSQISETVYRIPTTHVDQYKTKIEYLNELEKYVATEKRLIKQLDKKNKA